MRWEDQKDKGQKEIDPWHKTGMWRNVKKDLFFPSGQISPWGTWHNVQHRERFSLVLRQCWAELQANKFVFGIILLSFQRNTRFTTLPTYQFSTFQFYSKKNTNLTHTINWVCPVYLPQVPLCRQTNADLETRINNIQSANVDDSMPRRSLQ